MDVCSECKYRKPCEQLNYLDAANDCSDLRKFVDGIRADAIDECINTIVSTASEVASRETFNEHLFTIMADRQNEIIKLLEQLKENK